MTTTTPTPTTPSSDRRSATRAKLLDAALDVFAEKGLHGASVDDLAAAAGFTKGALYSNFATKEELFGAVIDEQVGPPASGAQERLEDTWNAVVWDGRARR